MATESNSPPWAAGAQAPAAPAADGAAPAAPPQDPATKVAPPAANTAGNAPPAPPAPAAPRAAASAPVRGDATAIAAAKNVLDDAQAELQEVDSFIEQAQKERKKRSAAADAAQAAYDRLLPPNTNHGAIASYLERQKKNLEARGAAILRAAEFRAEHGFSLADLMPGRAKVDAVRARRTGYGNARPPAPVVPPTPVAGSEQK
jgi:hypothetical protein